MVKFTEADFLTSTTITRERRPRSKLTVVVPNIRLPIAPPSPLIAGANEDFKTEPFPTFEDPCPPVKSEPLHCVLHCKDAFCESMVRYERPIPPCRCAFKDMPSPMHPSFSEAVGPNVTLDETTFQAIRLLQSQTDSEHMIDIRREDAYKVLSQLEVLIAARALRNEDLLAAIRQHWPGRVTRAERVLAGLVEEFFKLVYQYVERITREAGKISLTVQQLHTELHVYAATGLKEWIEINCDDLIKDLLHRVVGEPFHDPGKVMEAVDFGRAGEVSKLWREWSNDVVGLFMWRNEEVRRCKIDRLIARVAGAMLGVHIAATAISYFLGCGE